MKIVSPSSPKWPPSWSDPGSRWPSRPERERRPASRTTSSGRPAPRSSPTPAATLSGASIVARVQPPSLEEVAALPAGVSVISFLQPVAAADIVQALAGQGGHRLQPRSAPPNQPGAVDGRALLPGHGGRVPGRPVGSRAPGQVLPDVHDRGRHGPTGQGPGHGSRRRRTAGHRHGQAPGSGGARLRRAGGGQRGGAEPRGHGSSSSPSRPRTAPVDTPRSSRRSTWPSNRSSWPPRWPLRMWSSPPRRSPAGRHRSW